MSSQKEVNGRLVQGYLNSIKEHFSNFLLERVVNLQDANVSSPRLMIFISERSIFIRAIQRCIIVSLMDIGMLLVCY